MTTKQTMLNISFNEKELAKKCCASWSMEKKKWTTTDEKTFYNSFNYIKNNDIILDVENLYTLGFRKVYDKFSETITFYAFKVSYVYEKTISARRGGTDLVYDTGVGFKNMMFININDEQLYHLNFYGSSKLINDKHCEYISGVDVYFRTDKNWFYRYKTFNDVHDYDYQDFIDNKINKKKVQQVYNIIKTYKKKNITGNSYHYNRIISNLFRHSIYLKMNIDPITTLTNINTDVANIIYEYV